MVLSGAFGDGVSARPSRFSLCEAVGLAVHLEDMDVVGQSVEERACEAFFTERGSPFIEG